MPVEIQVPLEGAAATTAVHFAAGGEPADRLFVLAHGAGAGQHHPFMTAMANRVAHLGVDVVTFNFPYTEQQRRLPDKAPVLEACFRTVIDTLRARPALAAAALFIGGKSMGGRMATHLAAQGVDGLAGVVALGYPLHAPGRPDRPRTAHLPAITAPVLIVQGSRDTFGTPDELAPVVATMRAPVTLHVVAGGDHSFAVPKRARDEVYQEVASVLAQWMAFAR